MQASAPPVIYEIVVNREETHLLWSTNFFYYQNVQIDPKTTARIHHDSFSHYARFERNSPWENVSYLSLKFNLFEKPSEKIILHLNGHGNCYRDPGLGRDSEPHQYIFDLSINGAYIQTLIAQDEAISTFADVNLALSADLFCEGENELELEFIESGFGKFILDNISMTSLEKK